MALDVPTGAATLAINVVMVGADEATAKLAALAGAVDQAAQTTTAASGRSTAAVVQNGQAMSQAAQLQREAFAGVALAAMQWAASMQQIANAAVSVVGAQQQVAQAAAQSVAPLNAARGAALALAAGNAEAAKGMGAIIPGLQNIEPAAAHSEGQVSRLGRSMMMMAGSMAGLPPVVSQVLYTLGMMETSLKTIIPIAAAVIAGFMVWRGAHAVLKETEQALGASDQAAGRAYEAMLQLQGAFGTLRGVKLGEPTAELAKLAEEADKARQRLVYASEEGIGNRFKAMTMQLRAMMIDLQSGQSMFTAQGPTQKALDQIMRLNEEVQRTGDFEKYNAALTRIGAEGGPAVQRIVAEFVKAAGAARGAAEAVAELRAQISNAAIAAAALRMQFGLAALADMGRQLAAQQRIVAAGQKGGEPAYRRQQIVEEVRAQATAAFDAWKVSPEAKGITVNIGEPGPMGGIGGVVPAAATTFEQVERLRQIPPEFEKIMRATVAARLSNDALLQSFQKGAGGADKYASALEKVGQQDAKLALDIQQAVESLGKEGLALEIVGNKYNALRRVQEAAQQGVKGRDLAQVQRAAEAEEITNNALAVMRYANAWQQEQRALTEAHRAAMQALKDEGDQIGLEGKALDDLKIKQEYAARAAAAVVEANKAAQGAGLAATGTQITALQAAAARATQATQAAQAAAQTAVQAADRARTSKPASASAPTKEPTAGPKDLAAAEAYAAALRDQQAAAVAAAQAAATLTGAQSALTTIDTQGMTIASALADAEAKRADVDARLANETIPAQVGALKTLHQIYTTLITTLNDLAAAQAKAHANAAARAQAEADLIAEATGMQIASLRRQGEAARATGLAQQLLLNADRAQLAVDQALAEGKRGVAAAIVEAKISAANATRAQEDYNAILAAATERARAFAKAERDIADASAQLGRSIRSDVLGAMSELFENGLRNFQGFATFLLDLTSKLGPSFDKAIEVYKQKIDEAKEQQASLREAAAAESLGHVGYQPAGVTLGAGAALGQLGFPNGKVTLDAGEGFEKLVRELDDTNDSIAAWQRALDGLALAAKATQAVGMGVGAIQAAYTMGQKGGAGGVLGGVLSTAMTGAEIAKMFGASPAIGAGIGAVTGLVSGLLGMGSAASKARKEIEAFNKAFAPTFAAWQAEATGAATDVTRALAANASQAMQFRAQIEESLGGKRKQGERERWLKEIDRVEAEGRKQVAVEFWKTIDAQLAALDPAGQYVAALKAIDEAYEDNIHSAQAVAATADQLAKIEELHTKALAKAAAQEAERVAAIQTELDARQAEAQWLTKDAEAITEAGERRKGLFDAEQAGYSDTQIEQLKYVQSLEAIKSAVEKAREAFRATEDQLLAARATGATSDAQRQAAETAAQEVRHRRELEDLRAQQASDELIAATTARQAAEDAALAWSHTQDAIKGTLSDLQKQFDVLGTSAQDQAKYVARLYGLEGKSEQELKNEFIRIVSPDEVASGLRYAINSAGGDIRDTMAPLTEMLLNAANTLGKDETSWIAELARNTETFSTASGAAAKAAEDEARAKAQAATAASSGATTTAQDQWLQAQVQTVDAIDRVEGAIQRTNAPAPDAATTGLIQQVAQYVAQFKDALVGDEQAKAVPTDLVEQQASQAAALQTAMVAFGQNITAANALAMVQQHTDLVALLNAVSAMSGGTSLGDLLTDLVGQLPPDVAQYLRDSLTSYFGGAWTTEGLTDQQRAYNDAIATTLDYMQAAQPKSDQEVIDNYNKAVVGTVSSISAGQANGVIGRLDTSNLHLAAIEDLMRRAVLGGGTTALGTQGFSAFGAPAAPAGTIYSVTIQVSGADFEAWMAKAPPNVIAVVDSALGTGTSRTRAAAGTTRA